MTNLESPVKNPKKLLFNLIDIIEATNKDYVSPLMYTVEHLEASKKKMMFKTVIHIRWPIAIFEIEIISKDRNSAEHSACLQACKKLKELGLLDQSYEPLAPIIRDYHLDMQQSKNDLNNIFQRIQCTSGNKQIVPKCKIDPPDNQLSRYTYKLIIPYPHEMTFSAEAFIVKHAEFLAVTKALLWFESLGIVCKRRKFIEFTKENKWKLKKSSLPPYPFQLPPAIQVKLQNFIEFEKYLSSNSEEQFLTNFKNLSLGDVESVTNENPIKTAEEINKYQIISTECIDQYKKPSLDVNNSIIKENLVQPIKKYSMANRNCLSSLDVIQKTRSTLPIFDKRDIILKSIEENQVVILSGDTGCGKSTQVPQFILDEIIKKKDAECMCNIIVVEPRSISALSLAQRIADERHENVGNTVGHHVRLNRCLPQHNRSILFCTTGMMICKLQKNPSLNGVSHVIMDEVHERFIDIDFILILMKEILKINKFMKCVIMSAAINANFFSKYFNFCPVIHIPGKMYPIDEYFLEDLTNKIPNLINLKLKDATLDTDILTNVIIHIDETQPKGAVLCFLPGWHDIIVVKSKLLNCRRNNSLFVCLIHSKLSYEEQGNIFLPPPDGFRKIILATNIAETSITIDDVVYVVDSGLCKSAKLDVNMGMASLSTQWITKANVQQRKGRAGRLNAGKCYHLFSRNVFSSMEEYPAAEILRMPLENVVLKCKIFFPNMKVEDFFLKAPQPPNLTSIRYSVKELQVLGILDDYEKLTDLGKIVGRISTHPRLSVALVYALFLGCLDPVLTLCAILSLEKDTSLNDLQDEWLIKKMQQLYDSEKDLCSDYLFYISLYNTWIKERQDANNAISVEEKLLDNQIFLSIRQLKELFAADLSAAKCIPCANVYCDGSYEFNANCHHAPSILAALTAAFFPNVIRCVPGDIISKKMNTNTFTYYLSKRGEACIHKESVIVDKEILFSPWLIFYKAMKSEARKKALVSCTSCVPSICILLFCKGSMSIKKTSNLDKNQEKSVLVSFGSYRKLNFICTETDAHLLLNSRNCLNHIFNLYLQSLRVSRKDPVFLQFYRYKFLKIITEILEVPQVPFSINYE